MPHALFKELYLAHRSDVFRFARSRVVDHEVAEDITADTFELAWRRLQASSPIDRRWLIAVAGFKVRDWLKSARRQRAAMEAMAKRLAERRRGADLLDLVALHAALSALNERERLALHLTYWEGWKADEVAAVVGTSRAGVWMLLSRARRLLLVALSPSSTNDDQRHPGCIRHGRQDL